MALQQHESADRIDLALSGGGIRSATFSLGVLQALARYGWLGRIRTLSTVSGGGYIGAFLCRLAARVQATGPWTAEQAWAHTGRILLTPTSQDVSLSPDTRSCPQHAATLVFHAVQWLRENSRYLTPSGSSDALNGLAYYLRGLLALHFDLGIVLLLAALSLNVMLAAGVDAFWPGGESKESARAYLAQFGSQHAPVCAGPVTCSTPVH